MRKKFTVSAILALLLSLLTGVTTAHAGGSYKVNGSGQSAAINSTYSMTAGNTYSFDFTGTSWATVMVKLWGAGGGSASNAGGAGGYVEGILNVGTYKTFTIVVGGAGTSTYSGTTVTTPGGTAYYTTAGFNGGGRGVSNATTANWTGAGGGATDLRLNFTTVTDYANANRILVAGGGGGATANTNCKGGAGGYPNGGAGLGYGGADGGTQSAGGSLNGSFGLGGENINNTGWNGGGGGGWYGGGAQKTQHGGGAGGSSYYDSAKITSFAYGTGSAAATGGSATLTILTDGDTTPPTITSANTFSVNENATSIATVTANETSTWTISAGVDSATVQVDSSTGALTFKTARNYESPGDTDLNNTYIFTIMATDTGGNTATQSITVTILNLNEAPAISSNGGGDTATITLAENTSNVTTVQATDPDSGTTLTFSISGVDSADFVINPSQGSLTFANNPDFENPADSNTDNRYQINLLVTDGSLFDTQTVTIVITDVTETVILGTPTISGNPQKGVSISITSTANVAGKATFYIAGKKLAQCVSVSTTGSGTFSLSCSWKPAVQGRQLIYFVFKPSAQGFLQSTSSTLTTNVLRRTGTR